MVGVGLDVKIPGQSVGGRGIGVVKAAAIIVMDWIGNEQPSYPAAKVTSLAGKKRKGSRQLANYHSKSQRLVPHAGGEAGGGAP